MRFVLSLVFLVPVIFRVVLCVADEDPIIRHGDIFHPTLGRGGMVVSQDAIASGVGADILSRGGNAVDAAVATGFALAVTLPQAGNLGGGGFMMLYLAEDDRTLAIDYREMAPALAHRDLFLDSAGNVDREKSRFGLLATGVPGTVAGLVHVQEKYGSLPLKEVMQPAIRLAEKGIPVSYALAFSLTRASGRLRQYPASQAYFFRGDGSSLQAGDIWRQKDLAKTLRRIADKGAAGFYQGKTADLIVAAMAAGGGLISHQDLENYRAVERQPVRGTYRGYDILSMPPPSSGGVHLVQMLNILEGWQLAPLEHNSAAYLHRLAETMRRAYADRSQYLGDPDFYPVPLARLTDKGYAGSLRQAIDLDRASNSEDIRPGVQLEEESPQTTHFAVWDDAGNVVSNTYTLNFSYGNGQAVAGAGFLLNNEMDDFSAKPGVPNAYGLVGDEANAIAAGKRPLSSMTPAIVFRDGRPVLVTGSSGGSRIITAVLQVILNYVDFGMNAAEATAAPRVHHQWLPDVLFLEKGVSRDTRDILDAMGHQLDTRAGAISRTQTITRDDGLFQGVTDYRWPGGAAVSPR